MTHSMRPCHAGRPEPEAPGGDPWLLTEDAVPLYLIVALYAGATVVGWLVGRAIVRRQGWGE